MSTITFDTLTFAEELKKGGFTTEQAENQVRAQAKLLTSLLEGNLVTKQDLQQTEILFKKDMENFEANLCNEMKHLKVNLHNEMEHLETNLRNEMQQIEARLLLKLVSAMIITLELFSTFIGVFLKLVH